MPDRPWTIESARDALRRSSSAQLHTEQGLREAAKGQAEAEQSYRGRRAA